MSSPLFPDLERYEAFLTTLKSHIRNAQVRAALAVNNELMLLYWKIGKEILTRQQQEAWGSKVIERLAKDLKHEFPDMAGFSTRNLKYMKAFAEAYPDEVIGQRSVAQLPWRHNIALLEKLNDPQQRLWYAQQALEHGWSRDILVMQIESALYQRQGGAITNFEQTLPKSQSDLARQLLKDPYHFDFLTLGKEAQERDLERGLVDHIRHFLLELGTGFSFVGEGVISTNNREEQRKLIRYNHLITTCLIFYNVVEISRILQELTIEDYPLEADAIATLSPYWTQHVNRLNPIFIGVSSLSLSLFLMLHH